MNTSHLSQASIRAIAIFEAAKGLLVIVVGLGLLRYLDSDLQSIGENWVLQLHLNPASRYPRIFLQALEKFENVRISMLALGAFAYATVRLVEAYGLWKNRAWAEWFAIVAGGIFIPVEIYEWIKHPTYFKTLVFILNVLIVAYLLRVRLGKIQQKKNE